MDITNPTSVLNVLRNLANQISDAADRDQRINADACVQLAKTFQQLDEWLCSGGDAPSQWTS